MTNGGKSRQINRSPQEGRCMAEPRDAGCLFCWEHSSLPLGMTTLISEVQAQLSSSPHDSLADLTWPEHPWGLAMC